MQAQPATAHKGWVKSPHPMLQMSREILRINCAFNVLEQKELFVIIPGLLEDFSTRTVYALPQHDRRAGPCLSE